jgi:hypothetical protein
MSKNKVLIQQLVAAASAGQSARCLELIESKANVDAVDRWCKPSQTALTAAISRHKTATALALLNAKASLQAAPACGSTPLHCAVHRNNASLCNELLLRGADIESKTRYGSTPLNLAIYSRMSSMVTRLLNAGAKKDNALEYAIIEGRKTCADAIYAWLKDRDAAAAFARVTMDARRTTHKKGVWTDSMLFDKNLIAEITAFVTPCAPPLPTMTKKTTNQAAESKQT